MITLDNSYNNTHIKQVYPSHDDLISIGTNQINLTFVHPIELTVAVNISIYLKYNDEYFLRQRFLCTSQYCVISDDDHSLTINLLDITFNVPNMIYYVEIDDKFLKYKDESIIIPGIKLGNWMIKTTEGI